MIRILSRSTKPARRLLVAATWVLAANCAAPRPQRDWQPLPDDRRPAPQPKAVELNIASDLIDKTFAQQFEESLDLSRQLRNLVGRPKRAYNADPFGEVANSSWFTNRNGSRRMSILEISTGPDKGAKPDPSSTWTIFRAKTEGVTPGLHVRDAQGVRWVIKFEPLGAPELNTGAEVVSTKLFHAAGYHVPENYIVVFDPAILRIGDATVKDSTGAKRRMSPSDLKALLDRVQQRPDGRIRVVASKYLPGALIGPFRYEGTRKDDPNDYIPHQHRRELRGLRIFAGWLNHYDTKANNTLTVYLEKERYVRHYLIDFGSTLGSQGDEPMPPQIGHENSLDPHQILANTLTLGLHVRGWEKAGKVVYPSVGYFESGLYKSEKYKFITPNPAFELMTDEDAFWGAKLVMSFTDEQLKAAVAAGEYSNPEAAAYLLKTIRERRDIVGRHWFNKLTPADSFKVAGSRDAGWSLTFMNLGVTSGMFDAAQIEYQTRVLPKDGRTAATTKMQKETVVALPDVSNNTEPSEIEVRISSRSAPGAPLARAARVFLRKNSDGAPEVYGVVRE